jgi:uncharacterized protein
VEPRVSLITLGSDDVARARAFYEALGWVGESPDGEVVFFQAGTQVVALWDRQLLVDDSGSTGTGEPTAVVLSHNVGSPTEVDSVLARARAAGAAITRSAAPTGWGGYSGVFVDPDGHPWEVAHNPGWRLGPGGAVHLHDPTDDDRAGVAAWIEAWGAEVVAADVARGRERFAPDLVAFGTHADVVHGRDEVEAQQWSRIWPAIEDFAFSVDQLEVIVSPDRLQAVVVVPWTSTGIAEDGSRFDRPGRATVVLVRAALEQPWAGVHTHFSLGRGVPQTTHGQRPLRG